MRVSSSYIFGMPALLLAEKWEGGSAFVVPQVIQSVWLTWRRLRAVLLRWVGKGSTVLEVRRPQARCEARSLNVVCAALFSEHVIGHLCLLPCKPVPCFLQVNAAGCESLAGAEQGLLVVLAPTCPSRPLRRHPPYRAGLFHSQHPMSAECLPFLPTASVVVK